ncbi:hypothetical protein GV829_12175 [Sphingomonas lacunae]|uniref:Uncharacterized protein n=1 Tax=Sphingomonas lacunae TaxID=2698828 RepID=A0A6M4AXJ8_9SPHN|nr:hypothetical protein [Sphingomonas lacunae]QJQ33102.1 hypothetical protein GV829_12175 [Sphingomonas lacunae]
MSELLFFTLDDLGHRQGYVLGIFAIVLLAVATVLLRDAWAWFEALGQQDTEMEVGPDEAEEITPPMTTETAKAPIFVASSHPAFGRRHREAA